MSTSANYITSRGVLNPRPTFLWYRSLPALALLPFLFKNTVGCFWKAFSFYRTKCKKGRQLGLTCNIHRVIVTSNTSFNISVPTQQAASIGAIGCQINQHSTAALPHLGS